MNVILNHVIDCSISTFKSYPIHKTVLFFSFYLYKKWNAPHYLNLNTYNLIISAKHKLTAFTKHLNKRMDFTIAFLLTPAGFFQTIVFQSFKWSYGFRDIYFVSWTPIKILLLLRKCCFKNLLLFHKFYFKAHFQDWIWVYT